MQEKSLWDISTMDRDKRQEGESTEPLPVPALTVASHPAMQRVGDRLLLHALTVGHSVGVSRGEPDFVPAGGTLGKPLLDLGLSRKPLVLAPGAQPGSVRVDPGESRQLTIPGMAPPGPWELSGEQVKAGVPLVLADRVVLVLHLAEPRAAAADAPGMVGNSVGIHRVRGHIEKVASLSVPVLIRGETGSGKELIAQAIHQRSSRKARPFLSVNLGAITKELAASELFGSRKGGFTGAVTKAGFFQAAHGGTLFLDEIGEAPLEVQAMLLRVLETGEFFPVGEHTPVRVDVRLVTATDAQLEKLIQEGRFKEPLLHRLAGYEIRVPPLRERREDIGLLFRHFAREELAELGEAHRLDAPPAANAPPWLPASLAVRLLMYEWPGNIRQLRNLTRQIVIGSREHSSLRLDPALEQELSRPSPSPSSPPPSEPPTPEPSATPKPPRRKLSDVSEEEIVRVLESTSWQLKTAADQLGVARTTLYDWRKQKLRASRASDLSDEEFARIYQECGRDVDSLSQRLKTSRWVLMLRLKDLGLV